MGSAFETEERDPLTHQVLGLAIDVHRAIGPGLLESAYAECLAHEFANAGIRFQREHPVPLRYKSIRLNCAYRLDFLIENQLIVELKCVERFEAAHQAQLLTYMRLCQASKGLLLNFNEARLKDGILRRVLTPSVSSALSACSV